MLHSKFGMLWLASLMGTHSRELLLSSFDYAQDARKEARILGLIKSVGLDKMGKRCAGLFSYTLS